MSFQTSAFFAQDCGLNDEDFRAYSRDLVFWMHVPEFTLCGTHQDVASLWDRLQKLGIPFPKKCVIFGLACWGLRSALQDDESDGSRVC